MNQSAPETDLPLSSTRAFAPPATPTQPRFCYDVTELFESEEGSRSADAFAATLPDGTPLPDWLRFDSGIGRFTGDPSQAAPGMIPVRVSARCGAVEREEIIAILVEECEGDLAAKALSTKPRKPAARRFRLELADRFRQLAQASSFSASLTNGCELPDWLELDERTGILSGRPTSDAIGTHSILVFASDGSRADNAIVCVEVEAASEGLTAIALPDLPPASELRLEYAKPDLPLEDESRLDEMSTTPEAASPTHDATLPLDFDSSQARAEPEVDLEPADPDAVDLPSATERAVLATGESSLGSATESEAPYDRDEASPETDLNRVLDRLAEARGVAPRPQPRFLPASGPVYFKRPQQLHSSAPVSQSSRRHAHRPLAARRHY